MITKIGIALHLISSCINLEEELEVRSVMRELNENSLNESEFCDDDDDDELSDWNESSIINDLSESFEYVPLFEHRGKPDPEKARAREEAHLRGNERHKNALDRNRKQELLRKSREAQRRRNHDTEVTKPSKEKDSQIENKHQQIDDEFQQKQQQQQQQHQSTEPPTKQEKMLADTAINKVKKSQFQLSSFTKKMVSSAPTSNSKSHAKKMSKDIESLNSGFNKNINSAEAKLTPNELKRRKEKAREEMADKYDEIESKYMSKMDTPAERLWFKKNFSKLKRVGVGTVDNVCDMMGYKAVYTDIKNATKFLLGSGE